MCGAVAADQRGGFQLGHNLGTHGRGFLTPRLWNSSPVVLLGEDFAVVSEGFSLATTSFH